VRRFLREIKREFRWALDSQRSVKSVFRHTYREGKWGGDDGRFDSGPGSVGEAAELYARTINEFIERNGIQSVVDLGCGDFQVGTRIVNNELNYVGVDVVDELIELNQRRFGSDRISFVCLDITQDPLPDGELCLLREVLQHLSNSQIARVLQAVAKYPYVIYTDYQPAASASFAPNRDIVHGHDTRLWKNSAVCLDQPPFNIPLRQLLEVESTQLLRSPGERIRTFLLLPPTSVHAGSGQSSTIA